MAIVRVDALRTLDYTGTSAAFAPVGGPTDVSWRMFRFINNTDGDMIFSFDGTTDNLFVPAYSFVLYDCSTNGQPIQQSDDFVVSLLTQIYVRQSTVPTKGAVWVEGVYAKGI